MNQSNSLFTLLTEWFAQQNEIPTILQDCSCSEPTAKQYEKYRLVFNRKFEFRPSLIVFVENTKQVSEVIKFANKNKDRVVLRVRSGGHDHEGECSGTDTLLIDFSKMNRVEILGEDIKVGKEKYPLVSVQPGARFNHIKPILDENDLGVPHGTCETVCIAGFTMGGGWGPWTRLHGMACESLMAATIVLGNGEVKNLSYKDNPKSDTAKLLWALRGGGGMSYGIVTELVFKAFKLPEVAFSFNIKFNQPAYTIEVDGKKIKIPEIKMPALEVLKLWERAVAPQSYPELIGTNLKIEAAHLPLGKDPDPNAELICQFNGYYGGSKVQLEKFIEEVLGKKASKGLLLKSDRKLLKGSPKNAKDGFNWHFESWDRQNYNLKKGSKKGEYHHIDLETDGPAPHKITSRVANCFKGDYADFTDNWDEESRIALISSLQSNKVPPDSDAKLPHGVHCYVTLGAISGSYYADYEKNKDSVGSSFPYKKRPFFIQYQAWWDQFLDKDEKHCFSEDYLLKELIKNRFFINRAQDWIEDCRDYPIKQTKGSFISFKDSSVTTAQYFLESYEELMKIKLKYSEDKNVLFRTRKTII